jgi:hypothetical protein
MDNILPKSIDLYEDLLIYTFVNSMGLLYRSMIYISHAEEMWQTDTKN